MRVGRLLLIVATLGCCGRTPKAQVPLAEPEPDFESLMARAKETKALADLMELARACSKLNQRIVLTVQYGPGMVTVIAGMPETADMLFSNSLTLRFKGFKESDKDLSKLAVRVITGNKGIRHNPPYCIYTDPSREIKISANDPLSYKIFSIHAESEFVDTNPLPAT